MAGDRNWKAREIRQREELAGLSAAEFIERQNRLDAEKGLSTSGVSWERVLADPEAREVVEDIVRRIQAQGGFRYRNRFVQELRLWLQTHGYTVGAKRVRDYLIRRAGMHPDYLR